MAVFPIRRFGDPVLRRKADPVDEVDEGVRKLIRDLTDTMDDAPGVGLAAPQIGVSRRVMVWRYEGDGGALANPRISEARGDLEGDEACLSLPGLVYPVVRPAWIRVEGLDEEGREVSREASDWVARIIQHEIDHLDGILFIDRLPPDLRGEAKRRLREEALGGETPSDAGAVL